MFTNGITLRQGREPLCPSHPAVRRADAETLRMEWAERRHRDNTTRAHTGSRERWSWSPVKIPSLIHRAPLFSFSSP